MYIDNNKSGTFYRSFHRFLCVLSASTVLFSVSGCNGAVNTDETHEPAALKAESQTPSEGATLPLPFESSIEATTTTDDSSLTETTSGIPTTTEALSDEMPDYSVTQAEINLDTLERLNSTYGVNIRYGSAVSWSYGASGTGITDESLIASRLILLEECLSLYPKELFADLNTYSPITINLIDNLDGADGYTDANNAASIQIALSSSNSDVYFKLAFHHELFHFMEYCIMHYIENGQNLLDTNELTDTILYGTNDYAGTIYDSTADIYHQYFTSIYGKTNAMEDRAELFSYYMGNTVKECMKTVDTPISLKMKKIAYAIRVCCPSLSAYPDGTLPWEEKIVY